MTAGNDQAMLRFLADAGWGTAHRAPLAGDASARRYERLTREAGADSAVLMIAEDAEDEIGRFVRIAGWLNDAGFSAPRILAQSAAQGYVLLEDLGDDLVARLVAKAPCREDELYREITRFLLALHTHAAPEDLPGINVSNFGEMTSLCGDWYLPAAGRARADFATPQALARAYGRLAPVTSVMCLRDFHAENLLWLPEREGVARLGLLDFQDAVTAHPAYDLVSVLQDARRDVSLLVEASERDYYAQSAGYDLADFKAAYALIGAQRSIRILGIFTRLCLQAGKAAYVDLIPRTWGYIERNLSHPNLATLADEFYAATPAPTDALLQRIKDQCGTLRTR
jgi:aminoglycoside/choline kinase family phosphotransferase